MSKTRENPPKSDEYNRFQELKRNLLAVPKKDVDKQKAKHEKSKDKRPAK